MSSEKDTGVICYQAVSVHPGREVPGGHSGTGGGVLCNFQYLLNYSHLTYKKENICRKGRYMIMSERDFFELGVSCIVFVICASAHRLMLPRMYMSLLVFRYTANPGKTMKSTAIRIIYISFSSIMLRKLCGFGEKNIYIGIFIACFFNIWPAIIQYHLIQFWKSIERVKLLLGYTVYCIFYSFLCAFIAMRDSNDV